MSIYEERPVKPEPKKQTEEEFEINPYIDLTDVLISKLKQLTSTERKLSFRFGIQQDKSVLKQ